MKIIEVTTPSDIKEFLGFPSRLYADDPNYIRPLDKDIEAVFSPEKNKLFKRKGKAARWLLQNEEGETIGKVAAFINPSTVNKDNEQPTGGMGFFDCINDQQAANLLFDTCKQWLSVQGMEAMDGPINFGDRDRWWGCLAEGFYEPNYCMHYNFPYYNELYTRYGFQTYFEQYTYYRDVERYIDDKLVQKALPIYNNPDYHFEHVRMKDLQQYGRDFAKVYSAAWGNHGGVRPISEEQGVRLFKSMKMVMDEKIAWFGYYKGEPVAFYLQIPEMNQVVKHIKSGKLNLWNKLRMFWHIKRKTSRKLFALVFGVAPAHQKKGVECAIVMAFSEFIRKEVLKKGITNEAGMELKGFHYNAIEMNWIGDFNPKMMRTAELIGAHIYKTHITYRKLFDESKPFKRMKIIH